MFINNVTRTIIHRTTFCLIIGYRYPTRLYTDRAPLYGLKSLSVCHVRVMCANWNRYYDIILIITRFALAKRIIDSEVMKTTQFDWEKEKKTKKVEINRIQKFASYHGRLFIYLTALWYSKQTIFFYHKKKERIDA